MVECERCREIKHECISNVQRSKTWWDVKNIKCVKHVEIKHDWT